MAIISPRFWGRDYGAGSSFLYLLGTQMLGLVDFPCIFKERPMKRDVADNLPDLVSLALLADGWFILPP